MRKYSMVHDTVTRLTDNPALRTFFTLYLMAASDKERQAINQRFWADAKMLDETEFKELQAAFANSFQQLLPLANQLHDKAQGAIQKSSPFPAT